MKDAIANIASKSVRAQYEDAHAPRLGTQVNGRSRAILS
jgi:hypothetical protein